MDAKPLLLVGHLLLIPAYFLIAAGIIVEIRHTLHNRVADTPQHQSVVSTATTTTTPPPLHEVHNVRSRAVEDRSDGAPHGI